MTTILPSKGAYFQPAPLPIISATHHVMARVRSNSHAPTAAPRGVAAVAAAAAAATATAEASVTAPSGGSGVGNTSSTRAAIGAAEALERFSASGGGGGGGGSGSNEGGQLGRKHGVARVRVRVRSSVYLIVVRLENNGSILLEDVSLSILQQRAE